tara:strand:- start:983 stop:2233 length:1251 start_codon:yes stop_codon:yes gene_type:complete
VEAEIENVRFKAGMIVDKTLLKPLGNDGQRKSSGNVGVNRQSKGTRAKPTVTFSEAYDRYLSDPTNAWSARTRDSLETGRRMAVSVIGADVRLSKLNRNQVRDYIEVLRFMPRNALKRFPKLSLREASKRAKQSGEPNLISSANINVYLSKLSSFLNWAVNEELLTRNPARGLRLHDETSKKNKRHPFSTEQLRTIFDAPLYRGCLNGDRGYAIVGDERPRNARFWVPLIGYHTGMRLNEICQLDVTDVRLIDEVRCFVVSDRSIVGSTDKRLKSRASERVIPVHNNLLECGLIEFVTKRVESGEKKLFCEIEAGKKGVRAVAFSKWFTQFLRKCGASAERTCFHSFRHNFRDELRFARIDQDIAMKLGGWTISGIGRGGASENYGDGHRIQTLHDAICQLKFAGTDIFHLIRGQL